MKKSNYKSNQWDDHGNRTGLWYFLANSDSNGNWAVNKALYLEDKREGEHIIIRGKKYEEKET